MPISFRKDTIILDLDHILLHAVDISDIPRDMRDYASFRLPGSSRSPGSLVFLRPHLFTFLEYCFGKYKKVILWSMGSRSYVESVLEELAKSGVFFHEVWTRDEFPLSKDVSAISVNRNRTLFLDDITDRIQNLHSENIIEASPYYYSALSTDSYLLELIVNL